MPRSPFTDPADSPYTPDGIFLGYSSPGHEIGIASERHFLCIAGSGTGKGSAFIVPNLRRWRGNALVIDPGGGNARATWEKREAMGQKVHVIDPAQISIRRDKFHDGVPSRLLKSFNPLARLDPSARTYGEDIGVIADGMVMRHDPKHARWDNAGVTILAGLIDFVRTAPNFEGHRTLIEVRRLITQAPDDLKGMFEAMAIPERNRPSIAAASLALADLKDPDGFIENAQQNTQWLDYTSMIETFAESNFELTDLKTEPCTVFLVIDPDYMIEHGRFLRLFVRSALSAMIKTNPVQEFDEPDRQCLFILDEFFSLGKLDYLQKAAGLLRKNGVQLLPILQDIGQGRTLYGDEGLATFFGNADAQIFFGSTDAQTLDYVSSRIGTYTGEDIGPPPLPRHVQLPDYPATGNQNTLYGKRQDLLWNIRFEEAWNERFEGDRLSAEYQEKRGQIGQPLVPPQLVREIISKKDGDPVAKSMIVFAKGGDIFNLRLAPYFQPPPPPLPPPAAAARADVPRPPRYVDTLPAEMAAANASLGSSLDAWERFAGRAGIMVICGFVVLATAVHLFGG